MPITQAVHGGGTSPTLTRRVYYTGTDTLKEGYPLCYNFDAIDTSAENLSLATGTQGADDECPARHIQVEKPSMFNALWFAGAVSSKGANVTGPGYVEINMPGSICNVWCGRNVDHAEETLAETTTGTGLATGQIVTFSTNDYLFEFAGCAGEGSAMVLQDVDRSTTSGLVMAKLMAGQPSGGVQNCYSANSSTYMASVVSYSLTFSTGGSIHFPKCGLTQINYSIGTADWTALLTKSDGEWIGQTKVFAIAHSDDLGVAALTEAFVVTASQCIITNASVAAANSEVDIVASLDTAEDSLTAVWSGSHWLVTLEGALI